MAANQIPAPTDACHDAKRCNTSAALPLPFFRLKMSFDDCEFLENTNSQCRKHEISDVEGHGEVTVEPFDLNH